MKILKKRRKPKRGYSIALLVGIEEKYSVVWKIFSRVTKHEKTLALKGQRKNSNELYNFHESIINVLRSILKAGTRSIILVSPARTTFTTDFIEHVYQHHKWLTQGKNKVALSEITGSASKISQVAKLTKTPKFQQIIELTAAEETENILSLLETNLHYSDSKNRVFFSINEVETLIIQNHKQCRIKPDYLLLTDKYLSESHEKNRLNRIMQIATNKKVKIKVMNSESPAGIHLSKLGGIVGIAKYE